MTWTYLPDVPESGGTYQNSHLEPVLTRVAPNRFEPVMTPRRTEGQYRPDLPPGLQWIGSCGYLPKVYAWKPVDEVAEVTEAARSCLERKEEGRR